MFGFICKIIYNNFLNSSLPILLSSLRGIYCQDLEISGAIIGDGDRKRAISSIGVGPMIWDNFSIFRTNCAIACGTRAYMLRGFLRMSRRGNGVRDSRNLLCFWPTTQHVYVCWNLAEYFRSTLLQFEWSKAVLNLGMSSFVSLAKLCSATSFTRTSYFFTLNFSNVED